jgi:hypothetical protein
MNNKFAQQIGSEEMYPKLLEKEYPNIVEKMSQHWQASSFESYVESLLFDERGDRAGFSQNILEEIFVLQNYYRSLQPARPVSIDTWADTVTIPRKQSKE